MADGSGEAVLAIEGVWKRYAAHTAVAGISLRVPRGVIYGLLGPNGAGKTTTLRMVNDILRPDEGRITLFGDLPPGRAAARRIGYLPEERGLYPKMTVRRVLTFLAELRGLDLGNGLMIDRWCDRLGLLAWIDRKVEDLSKGMQQKVQFAAAAMHQPDLLILDEPFSGLDPINADLLRDLVREQREAGKTILFSTHLMEHAEQLCDAVCILSRGQLVLDGNLAEVKRQAREARRRVVVEIENAPAAADAIPAPLQPGVCAAIGAISVEKGRYMIDLAEGASAGEILRHLAAAGLALARFERSEPTLHEIFVEKVSHG
jgi:ABC-2 type transport system ATP-binding protein